MRPRSGFAVRKVHTVRKSFTSANISSADTMLFLSAPPRLRVRKNLFIDKSEIPFSHFTLFSKRKMGEVARIAYILPRLWRGPRSLEQHKILSSFILREFWFYHRTLLVRSSHLLHKKLACLKAIYFFGGGGENRTRVQKWSPNTSTIISYFNFISNL